MARSKTRLDQLLVARGLAETRSRAQSLILAGSVRIQGAVHDKPGELVVDTVELELVEKLPYVSRGGYKLAHALDAFQLDLHGLIVLDAGASTGGFTDVALQRGAAKVYAVDVGYGQLDYRLRQDPRVVVYDRTNIRHLEQLPELVDAAVADLSFISLRLVMPAIRRLVKPDGWVVALIKPQFEAGADQVGKGGVVRDPRVHTAVLREVITTITTQGIQLQGLARSPITGPAGNVEFLAWFGPGPAIELLPALAQVVDR